MRRAVLGLLPCLAALFTLTACRNIDVVTATYASLEEARQAGAVERGWIPASIPAGAHDLREAHDLDSNRRWGLFSFPRAEADAMRAMLRPDELSWDGIACDVPGRIEWWPVVLRGGLDAERVTATGLRGYWSREGDLVVAVNWSQGRAYYWTPAGKGR